MRDTHKQKQFPFRTDDNFIKHVDKVAKEKHYYRNDYIIRALKNQLIADKREYKS
jgi:hypothetical protein